MFLFPINSSGDVFRCFHVLPVISGAVVRVWVPAFGVWFVVHTLRSRTEHLAAVLLLLLKVLFTVLSGGCYHGHFSGTEEGPLILVPL